MHHWTEIYCLISFPVWSKDLIAENSEKSCSSWLFATILLSCLVHYIRKKMISWIEKCPSVLSDSEVVCSKTPSKFQIKWNWPTIVYHIRIYLNLIGRFCNRWNISEAHFKWDHCQKIQRLQKAGRNFFSLYLIKIQNQLWVVDTRIALEFVSATLATLYLVHRVG